MWEKMYHMRIGDVEINFPDLNSTERLLRVPGGWIYTYLNKQGLSSVFMPIDN